MKNILIYSSILFMLLLSSCAPSIPTNQRIADKAMYGQPEIPRSEHIKELDEPFIKKTNSNFFDGIEEIMVEFICREEVNEELSLDTNAIISHIENALIQSRIEIYTDKSSYSKFSKSGRPILSFSLKKISTDSSPIIPIFVIKGELSLTVHPFNYKNEKAINRAALFHYEEYQIKRFDEKLFYSQIDNILFKFTRDTCKHMDCDRYHSPGKKIIPVNRKN